MCLSSMNYKNLPTT